MIMYNVIKILKYCEKNDLKLGTKEGIIITDKEGCIVFESDSKTRCFQQAAAWIEGNECENLF